jgi:hypothetical protein
MSDCVGKVEKIAKKPWITQEIISNMDEQNYGRVSIMKKEERNYRNMNNELRRATDKAKLEYLESKCDKIMELQKTRQYDLMYRKAMELEEKENNGIRTVDIEDSQGNIIADQKQVLKIWEIYVEELYDRANCPEHLNVELKDEVHKDHKGPHIICSEVEKVIKEMEDKKATRDDNIPVKALKLLQGDGLNLLTKLINNIYESGEWAKDFTQVTMVALKKKPKARKCTDHHTISLGRKLRTYLGKISLDFEKQKELEMQPECS